MRATCYFFLSRLMAESAYGAGASAMIGGKLTLFDKATKILHA
jgi:hypothetical protein